MAHGVRAASAIPVLARDRIEGTALGAQRAERTVGRVGEGLGGPGTCGLGVEDEGGHPREDSIEARLMVAAATGTFGPSRRAVRTLCSAG